MQPELRSIENAYQTPATAGAEQLQHRVIRNTYLLLAVSLIPTGIGALIGVNLSFAFMRASPIVSSLVLLAVIYGMFFAIEKNRDSGLGVALLLGLTLVVIPVAPDTYSVADIDAFAAAFDHADGPVLIHCGASATVGGVWSGYLVAKRGLSTTDALARGRAAGLKDGPMTDATERVFGEIEASSKPVLVPSAPVQ